MTSFRAAFVAVCLFLAGAVIPVSAQTGTFEHRVYLDLDNNPATGCSVTTAAGVVSGAEARLSASVSGQPPQVVTVTRETCVGTNFGSPQSQLAGYPVGRDLGVAGADVVEFSTALAGLGNGGPVRLVFASNSAAGADLVAAGSLVLPGATANPAAPTVIPTTGWLAALLLIGVVALVVRRHPALGSSLAVLLLIGTGVGVVWAAGFISDGQVGDWAGVPALATDPNNDSSSAEAPVEVVAVFATTEAGRLFLRVDVSNAEPPTNLPPAVNDATFAIAENAADASVVGAVVASDPDAGQTLSFALSAGNTGGAFAIDASGTLSVANRAALDFETTPVFTLTVTVTDDGVPALSDSASITINLADVNEAPVATNASFALDENSANATVVGSVAASDPDTTAPANTLAFAITAGNAGNAFAIDANSGQITVADSTQLDFETTPSRVLTVTVSDGGALSDSAAVTLTLRDVNEAPVLSDAARNVAENSPVGTAVGAPLAALDPDTAAPNNALSYAITAGNTGSAFQISSGGQLSVQTAAAVSVANSPFALTVTVTDGGGLSDSATVTVSVADLNDAPSFTRGADQSVLEDAGAQTVSGWATAIDDGDPAVVQTLAFSITNNSNPGLFASAPAVSPAGTLSYAPAADANGSATLTLVLMDDGGTAGGGVDTSPPQSFLITVGTVNDRPSFTVGADQTVLENAGLQTVSGWATALSAGPADESGQSLQFNVVGNSNPGLFSTGPAVSPGGDLSFTPAANASGSATLTLALQDNGGVVNGGQDTSATQTFVINVTDINAAPSFTVGANQTVNEDAGAQTVNGWATAIDDGDPGVTQTLTFNITGNTSPGLFAAGPAVSPTGVLTYTPTANASGSATISLTLMDDGGTANGGVDTSPPQSFLITVGTVNDRPSFTVGADQTVLENAGLQTVSGWATALSAGPADESGQSLQFNVVGNSNPGLFSTGPAVSPGGDLSFTPAANASGSATLTLALQDNGGVVNGGQDTSATQTFVINVTDINAAPSFTVGANQTVNEDAGAQTVNGWATAIDDGDPGVTQTLTFNITGNTSPGLFAAGPAVSPTGVLTYTPTANASGSATISLTLMDDGGTANGGADTSSAQSFTITVAPVNDAPTATAKSHTTHSAIELEIIAASHTGELLEGAADVDDPTGELTAVLVAGSELPAGAVVTITNPSDGSFRYDPPGGYSGPGSFQFRICDDGAPVAPQQCSAATTVSFTITGPELWFVDDDAASGGDGGLNDPFDSLADLPAGRGTGDRIYVFSGSYATALSLNADEQLIGQGHSGSSAALLGVVPVSNGVLDTTPMAGSAPTLGNTLTLGGNNALLRGVLISSGANTGLVAGAVSNVGVSESSVSAASGTAVSFDGTSGNITLSATSSGGGVNGILLNNVSGSFAFGSGALSGHSGVSFRGIGTLGTTSYQGSISKSSAGNLIEFSGAGAGDVTLSGSLSCSSACSGIDVLSRNAGTLTFSGASKVLNTGANAAVNLTGNSGASIVFSGGGLDIDTTSGTGFNASGGGTLVVTGSGNSIASTAGTAASIVSTVIGPSGATFQSVSASGAALGIRLDNAGSGGFTVTGVGSTDGSGGTIANITQRGISVIATDTVSLANMSFNSAGTTNGASNCDANSNVGCHAAIHLDTVATAVLNNVDITNTTAQYAINGRSVAGFALRNSSATNCGDDNDEGCLRLFNATGTAEISNSTLSFASDLVAQIANDSGTLALTVSGSTFSDTQSAPAFGTDGLELQARGTSNMNVDVINSSFARNRVIGLDVLAEDSAVATIDVTGSSFDRGTGSGSGINLSALGSAQLSYNVINNPLISASGGDAFNSNAGGSAVVRGRVNNNADIQVGTGSLGDGIRLMAFDSADMIVEVAGNTISRIGFDQGISAEARNLTGGACGTSCTAGRLDVTVSNNALSLDAGGGSLFGVVTWARDSNTVCARISGNVVNNLGLGFEAYRARTSSVLASLLLQGFNTDAVGTWNGNGNTPAGSVSSSQTGTLAGATCRVASHPLP